MIDNIEISNSKNLHDHCNLAALSSIIVMKFVGNAEGGHNTELTPTLWNLVWQCKTVGD